MPRLVICEKPSVAGDVADALGRLRPLADRYENEEWVVTWAVGHLLEQVPPEKYNPAWKRWRYDDLPMVPDAFAYQARNPKAGSRLKDIHALMKRDDITGIVNACDAGREGELIFALIRGSATKKAQAKPVERAWFAALTPAAIREAFAHLRPGAQMMHLEAAARARSEADWLVGINATRAASITCSRPGRPLSIGRVQTPTLALICRRDKEIATFVPEAYCEIAATFNTDAGEQYSGTWFAPGTDRITDAVTADAIIAACTGSDAQVSAVETTAFSEAPPALYDLTALQRDANSRHSMTAKRTLEAAQALYDQHKLITYPRTNSRALPSALEPTLGGVCRTLAGVPELARAATEAETRLGAGAAARVIDDAKVSDHHAIIPTDLAPDLSRLSPQELRVWGMIVRRFLAALLPDCTGERTRVVTACAGHTFRSRGRVVHQAGWRSVEAQRDKDDDTLLPALAQGERVRVGDIARLDKQTKPPAHYSDATLLGAMERAGRFVDDEAAAAAMAEAGLGTPATRAAIIDGLLTRGYVERDGKALVATETGMALIDTLGDHPLTRPDLTGEWEERLARIEAGEEDAGAFHDDVTAFAAQVVAGFAGKQLIRPDREALADCPRCEGQIVERPKSYGCTSYHGKKDPGCGYLLWKTVGSHELTREEVLGHIAAGRSAADIVPVREVIGSCPTPGCDGEIVERGKGYGCTSWRSRTETGCGFVVWKRVRGASEDIDIDTARAMVARGESNATVRTPLADCPVGDCDGQIIERGRGFGCNSWQSRTRPGCGYVIWKRGRDGEVTRAQAEARIAADRAAGIKAPNGPPSS